MSDQPDALIVKLEDIAPYRSVEEMRQAIECLKAERDAYHHNWMQENDTVLKQALIIHKINDELVKYFEGFK